MLRYYSVRQEIADAMGLVASALDLPFFVMICVVWIKERRSKGALSRIGKGAALSFAQGCFSHISPEKVGLSIKKHHDKQLQPTEGGLEVCVDAVSTDHVFMGYGPTARLLRSRSEPTPTG